MSDSDLIETIYQMVQQALADDHFQATVVKVSGNRVTLKRPDQRGKDGQTYPAFEAVIGGVTVTVPTHGTIVVIPPLAPGDRVGVQRLGASWVVTGKING